jgi:hypothetical protein
MGVVETFHQRRTATTVRELVQAHPATKSQHVITTSWQLVHSRTAARWSSVTIGVFDGAHCEPKGETSEVSRKSSLEGPVAHLWHTRVRNVV